MRQQEPRRVLVIDDNRAMHDALRRVLGGVEEFELDTVEALLLGDAPPRVELGSFEVTSAYQGDEGLQLVRESIENKTPFDVVFVDMRMPPGLDGVETIESLWVIDPMCPVVLCGPGTEYPWSELVRRLGQNDQWLVLRKPFQHAEVAQAATAMAIKRRKQSSAQQRHIELQKVIDAQTAELRRSAEEAERLFNAISSLLIGIDAEGRVTRWNGAASETFGIAADNAVGTRFLDLPIRWTSKEQLEQVLSGFRDREELTFEDSDLQIHVLGITACPIRPRGTLLVARDITEVRANEQRLSQTKKMEAIGHLAAGVAHEINTPMQYLGDNLQYIAQMLERIQPLFAEFQTGGAAAEELRNIVALEHIQKMMTSVPDALSDSLDGVQQVARIVSGLKEFSHPQDAQKAPLDINHCLESTIAVARNEWKYVADVQRDFANELPETHAFGGELKQVFVNLLVNAAHSIGERTNQGADGKGTICIRTRRFKDSVEVQVEDDGVGMSVETLGRAFQPFFTTKPIGKGTGQGLAFAKKIIEERHDGQIWFETWEGEGACCFIRIPIRVETEKPPADCSEDRLIEELA